jgi:hypothetical protein
MPKIQKLMPGENPVLGLCTQKQGKHRSENLVEAVKPATNGAEVAFKQLSGSGGYSNIPNILFDLMRGILKRNEYDVFMYIVRRTLGFHKLSDAISLSQFQSGIVKQDGQRLDYGCGIKSTDTILRAVRELERLGFVTRQQVQERNGAFSSTIYTLCPEAILQAVKPEQEEVEREEEKAVILIKEKASSENREGLAENKRDRIQVLQKTSQQKNRNHGLVEKSSEKLRLKKDWELLKDFGFEDEIALDLATQIQVRKKKENYLLDIIAYCKRNANNNPQGMARRLIEQGEERSSLPKQSKFEGKSSKSLIASTFKPASKWVERLNKPFVANQIDIFGLDKERLWKLTCQIIQHQFGKKDLVRLLQAFSLDNFEQKEGKVSINLKPGEAWQKRLISQADLSLIALSLRQNLKQAVECRIVD